MRYSDIQPSSVLFSRSFMSDSLWPPWTAACHISLSTTNSQSLLKLMSIKLVMPSSHLILCRPLLLLPSIFPSIRIFSNELALTSGSQSIVTSASASFFLMNIQSWFSLGLTDLISFQLKRLSSLNQSHSSKVSILWCSIRLYGPTLTSVHDYWKNHSFDYMDLCWHGDISAF